MKVEGDEFGDWLKVDGEEFGPSGDGEFEILASRLRQVRLTDIPRGFSIRPCDRVINSDELFHRSPDCLFEHTRDGLLMAHGETVFIAEDPDISPAAREQYFRDSILAARRSLEPLLADGTMTQLDDHLSKEIAYLKERTVSGTVSQPECGWPILPKVLPSQGFSRCKVAIWEVLKRLVQPSRAWSAANRGFSGRADRNLVWHFAWWRKELRSTYLQPSLHLSHAIFLR